METLGAVETPRGASTAKRTTVWTPGDGAQAAGVMETPRGVETNGRHRHRIGSVETPADRCCDIKKACAHCEA